MTGALSYATKHAIVVYDGPRPTPSFARGGLVKHADAVRKAGRYGDCQLIHVNDEELDFLRSIMGEPTINPETGLPEYFSFSKMLKYIAPVVAALLPGVGSAVGGMLPGVTAGSAAANVFGSALVGGGVGALTGGKKGALTGALLGGGTAALAPVVGNVFGEGGADTIFGEGVGSNLFKASADSNGAGALTGAMGDVADPGSYGEYLESGGAALQGPASSLGDVTRGDLSGVLPAVGGSVPTGNSIGNFTPVSQAAAQSAAAQSAATGAAAGEAAKKSGTLMSWVQENPGTAALVAAPLVMGAMQEEQPSRAGGSQQSVASNWNSAPTITPFPRKYKKVSDPNAYYTYGTNPFEQFDDNALTGPVAAATGGALQDGELVPDQGSLMAMEGPAAAPGAPLSGEAPGEPFSGYVTGGEGDGRADTIDAKLSNNEYVIDAETVALLGNGSPDAGAEKLDEFRRKVRAAKGSALAKGEISPDAEDPMAYLGIDEGVA